MEKYISPELEIQKVSKVDVLMASENEYGAEIGDGFWS